ncbi:MAG: hypothetical protein ISS69_11985 [Phycisphaerae bacterium]|nr:hypothetical protein [Planctomycetota bacterium]MBL7220827.1 hypothetical protein [Phycisphaerae bacterium]
MIYRRSLRYTLFVVGISILGVLASSFSLPGLSIRQAIALPLIVGGLALVIGSALKIIPGLISSRLQMVAQASDLNLMEDYRKTQGPVHLDAIWRRVFRYESILGDVAADDEAQKLAKSDFLARAEEALASHLPQIRQMHLIGLDLRYLEDWRDGAYLDCSDTKLTEQFEGNSTLTAVRREVGLWGAVGMRNFTIRKISRGLWFRFITRMVAMEIGGSVEQLNRLYKTDLFNSQVLLWPGEAESPWLGAFEGAHDEVLRRRRKAIRNVFGPDIETAGEVIDRMLYTDFALATELRTRYDVEYCTGALGYDALEDLRTGCREPRDLRRAERTGQQAGKGRIALKRFLTTHRSELLKPKNAGALRAVKIAFHINKDNLKHKIIDHAIRGRVSGPIDEILAVIDTVAGDERTFTRRLVAVRMHHEMTRLARSGYYQLVQTLGYANGRF